MLFDTGDLDWNIGSSKGLTGHSTEAGILVEDIVQGWWGLKKRYHRDLIIEITMA